MKIKLLLFLILSNLITNCAKEERKILALFDAYEGNIPQLLAQTIENNNYNLAKHIIDIYPETIDLEGSINLNSPKLTPLNRALQSVPTLTIAHFFIDKRANINKKNSYDLKTTPLLTAIKGLDNRLSWYKSKQIPDQQKTQLSKLAIDSYAGIIIKLIERGGAEIKTQDSLGYNALYYAQDIKEIRNILEKQLEKNRKLGAKIELEKHLPSVLANIILQYFNHPELDYEN